MKLKQVTQSLLSLVYPLTKKKLHRLANYAGLALTAALMVAVWFTEHYLAVKLTVVQKLGADMAILIPLLTKWQVLLKTADAGIDRLPIPDDVALAAATAQVDAAATNLDKVMADRPPTKGPTQ